MERGACLRARTCGRGVLSAAAASRAGVQAELRQCVMNGPTVWPGANAVEDENGRMIDLSTRDAHQREAIARTLLTKASGGGDAAGASPRARARSVPASCARVSERVGCACARHVAACQAGVATPAQRRHFAREPAADAAQAVDHGAPRARAHDAVYHPHELRELFHVQRGLRRR